MSEKRFACPKCGSENTAKDRHQFGGDTGDRTCLDCKYTTSRNSFEKAGRNNNSDEA